MSVTNLRADVLSEQKLSEQFFESLLESAPDAMILVDREGCIAIVNGQAEKMFGYDRDELLGRKIEVLIPARLHDRHALHRDGFAERPAIRPMGTGMELLGCRRDGSEFPVEISLSPLSTDAGFFVSSVIRDVTERKAMESAVLESQQEAERANKANRAFLAAASHDLRQPVQALTLLNGALRRTLTDSKALAMLDSQNQSLVAMTNLLNSLLDISRLDAGAVTPEIEEFSTGRLIEPLSSEFSRQAKQKGLTFEWHACNAVVRSDPNLLREIIQNFVSNAIRYTDSGGVTLQCYLGTSDCRIEVRDTGIGIAEDQLEEIFTEFHQCRTPGSSREGFGLGLAIVKRLAQLLGHEVNVESTCGKGSAFSITVPLAGAQRDADNESAAVTETGGVEKSAGLVLLIEDDEAVRGALSLLLEAEGYTVVTATDKTTALSATETLPAVPALIVSDYHLANSENGVNTIMTIRERYAQDIPALVITGDTSRIVEDAKSLGNSTLLNKPIDPEKLLELARAAATRGLDGED